MSKKIGIRISGPLPSGSIEISCICENLIVEKIKEGEKEKTIICNKCGATVMVKNQISHYHIFITL